MNNNNIFIPAEEPGSSKMDLGSARCALDRDDRFSEINLPPFNRIIKFSFLMIFLAVLSYYFVDRPVAVWTYYNSKIHPLHVLWDYPTHLQPLFYFFSPWLIIYLVIKSTRPGKQITINDRIIFLMVLALWLSMLMSEEMRILFGRPWASTWFHGNLSYIQHGVYGFTWLQTAHEYKSFPSGHTTLTFAFMMSLWWQVSSKFLRLFAFICCVLVPSGLILMCYHWVSDVIIGALVGTLSAYAILYSYQCLNLKKDVKK